MRTTSLWAAAAVAVALTTSPAAAADEPSKDGVTARRPSPTVSITLADPSPIIGVTGETALRIDVSDAPAEGMPLPRVLCSIGQVEDLGREGPASFSARYILPAGRFPQPTIIVAEFDGGPWPLRGMTTVRLRAATSISRRTDPGAKVTLRVGDRDFGPQTASAGGVVHIPVVVPPGVEVATARAVNAYGKATEQVVDLGVPYSQRVLFAAPETMAAGSVADIAVYAVEPSGRPANGSSLILRAADARVTPLGSRIPGEARFLVRAPSVLREKSVRLEAQVEGQSTTRLATLVGLVAGPATGLTLEPEASFLPAGGDAIRVFLGAEDAFGNRVDASHADVLVDGTPESLKTGGDGQAHVMVRASAGQKQVVVEAVLDGGRAVRSIPVGAPPKPPTRLPFDDPSPRYTLTSRLGFLWSLGEAEGVMAFADATSFRIRRLPDLGIGLSIGVIQSWFVAESGDGMSKATLTTVPLLVRLHYRANAGRTFVGIGAGAGFALAFGRFHSFGATVADHSYGGAAEASVETGLHLRRGHLVLAAHYMLVSLARFASGDVVTNNAAGLAFDVGYRLGF